MIELDIQNFTLELSFGQFWIKHEYGRYPIIMTPFDFVKLHEIERLPFESGQYNEPIHLKHDPLGHLNLSIEGLQKRDELVFAIAKQHNVPVAVTLGGGYSEEVVRIHCNTVYAAQAAFI